jgi:hypothetical protein
MESEMQTERPALSEEINPEQPERQAAYRQVTYKSVLAAVVIGILTISVLWFFVIGQEEVPSNIALVAVPDTEVHDETNEKGALVAPMADEIGLIDRRLLSIRSDRAGVRGATNQQFQFEASTFRHVSGYPDNQGNDCRSTRNQPAIRSPDQ